MVLRVPEKRFWPERLQARLKYLSTMLAALNLMKFLLAKGLSVYETFLVYFRLLLVLSICLFQARAKTTTPCIIFIDEIDSVGSKRTSSSLHPYANQTINQLLSEMDGFVQNEGIIIIGATNRKEGFTFTFSFTFYIVLLL